MAAYPKPTSNTGIFNNQSFVHPDTGGLTIDEAKQYFVTFPNTQSPSTIVADNFNTTGSLNVAGDSQFGGDVEFIGGVSITGEIVFENDVEVTGTTTLDDNLLCLTTATVTDLLTCEGGIDITTLGDGITFPDNTTQTTAFIEANYAQLNTDNTFLAPFIQIFQQNNSTTPSTASLQINNIQNSDNVAFYIDPSAGNDLTLYSSQSAGGLTVRNPTASFTLNPIVISPGIVGAQSINPIDMNAQNITGIGALAGNGGNVTCNSNLLMGATYSIDMNAQNIIDIGALAGINGNVTCNSDLLIGAGYKINMQTNTITNCSAINGSSGGTLLLGTQQPVYVSISGGSLTAGSNLGINSANGTCVFNYYTANNLSLNMSGTAQTFYIQNSNGNIMTFSETEIDANKNLNMNSFSLLNIGQNSTAYTQPDGTNNTSIATTAYVANNSPIYLQSSFTNIWAGTSSISPSTVNVITTRIASTNIVSFNNVNVIVNSNAGLGNTLLAQFQFNTNPWSTYPPAAGAANSISVYCNTNGATYSCVTSWVSSPATLWIGYPTGGPSTPSQFTVNLSSFGAFAG